MAIVCAIIRTVWPNRNIPSAILTRLQIAREHYMRENDTMLYAIFTSYR